jgi:hypothetical protein
MYNRRPISTVVDRDPDFQCWPDREYFFEILNAFFPDSKFLNTFARSGSDLFGEKSICFRKFCQCCGSGSGIRCLVDPWIRDGEKSGSGFEIRDEQPGSYLLQLRNNIFGLNPGSGMEKFGSVMRDGKKSDPGSGINISDPQH